MAGLMQQPKANISNEAPRFSLLKVVRTIADMGPLKAMDDPEQGPHVHLTLLIITILLVSALIIVATSIFL